MNPTRPHSARPAFVESLESRRLLAADLAVLAASTTNLASNGATGTITLKNTGTTPIRGPVDITFLATAAGKPNQIIGSKTVTLHELKTGLSTTITGIILKTPKNSSTDKSQVFNIVARITPRTTPADTAAGNNSKAATTGAGSSAKPATTIVVKPATHHIK